MPSRNGGSGFADVWKKSCFGWEYKGPNANLDAAYAQLQRYAVALENPPLLIVSDTKTIIIRTNWTNSVSETRTIALTDLVDAKARETLKNCFLNPEALRPKRTRDDLTREAANEFSALAQRLRDDGHNAETVAHFVNRMLFCMFAEDVGLTPNIPAAHYADDPRAQAIATAAARLNELRENWLNPPDLVKRVPEVVPGYPDRILPVDDKAAEILKKRTLTNLYNDRPAWLDHAHRDLDGAVASAYGWQADFDAGTLTEDEILKRLFELKQERAKKEQSEAK